MAERSPARALGPARGGGLRKAACALVGSACLVCLMAGPAPGRPLFGFNENWTPSGHDIRSSDPFRPTVGRLHLSWAAIEPVPGSYAWHETDVIYRAMVAQGAPPIALVMMPPCWAAAGPPPCAASEIRPVHPAHLEDWTRFVRAAVSRYPGLRALEVWNEPNFSAFYHPLPDVAGYVEILRRAHRAAKEVRPDLPVLGGSLAPMTTRSRAAGDGGFPRSAPGKLPYAPFLDRLYRLGAGRHMDGLAFHPYPNFAPYVGTRALRAAGVRRGLARGVRLDIEKQIRTVRRVGRRHGVRLPVWATETGVCTTGSSERRTTPAEQAVALEHTYLALERLRVRAIVAHRLWDVRVPGTPADNIENGCGLLETTGRRKPAWKVLRRLRDARVSRGARAGR